MPEREQQHFEPEHSSKLDPKAYLEQHLEPKREGIATPEGLSAPLAENVEYTDDPFNKLEVTRDGLSLEIVYGESATYKVMRAAELYLSPAQTKGPELREWRQLYSLKLKNEKGQQLNLDFSANTNGVEKGKPTTVVFRAGVNRSMNLGKSAGVLRHTVTEDNKHAEVRVVGADWYLDRLGVTGDEVAVTDALEAKIDEYLQTVLPPKK